MTQITNNAIRMKQINVELIKAALKALPYGTKSTIASATGLSVATCGNILKELLASGEVIETELEQPNGGRPARRFAYNTNYSYIACLYVSTEGGSHSITYAVANTIGEVIEEQSRKRDIIHYDAIDDLIGELTEKYENIKGIGIGIPGVVRQGVIGVCDFKELAGVPLGGRLKEKYGLEINVENDMNAAVYGFYQKQQYEEDKTVAYVILLKDNPPGSGIMADGHILKGNTNFAGEVSFLPFGMSRDDQLDCWNSDTGFIPLAIQTIASLIAVINPETIALTGELITPAKLDAIYNRCLDVIPEEHMPRLMYREKVHDDYMNGLISITLESLTYSLQLVEKRI